VKNEDILEQTEDIPDETGIIFLRTEISLVRPEDIPERNEIRLVQPDLRLAETEPIFCRDDLRLEQNEISPGETDLRLRRTGMDLARNVERLLRTGQWVMIPQSCPGDFLRSPVEHREFPARPAKWSIRPRLSRNERQQAAMQDRQRIIENLLWLNCHLQTWKT
jgi:hypothetical protein